MGVIWDILANTNTNCKDNYSIYEQMDNGMDMESISEDEKQKIVAKFRLLHPLKWKKGQIPQRHLSFCVVSVGKSSKSWEIGETKCCGLF